jgi:cupredoxin-like protein
VKSVTLQALVVVSTSILSAVLVYSTIFNWYQIATASGEEKKNNETTTNTLTTGASISNPIQLSVKEESENVYRWTSSSSGAINPMLKVLSNTNNTIKIQNPTDTKHELIIDTGTDVLPSSDDINPDGSGQLSFKPNMTGTFTYHCAYHPFTMKGTIQVVTGS